MAKPRSYKRLKEHGCMWCALKFTDPARLAEHFVRDHREHTVGGADRPHEKVGNLWPCMVCPEKFLTLEGLEHHSNINHQKKIL